VLLRDYLKRSANSYPEKVAFLDEDLARSWREVDERTDRLGSAFQGLGVQKGDTVAILAHDHIEMVEHWLACAKIGAIRVGINWRYSAREKLHIIRDSDAKVVIIQSRCMEGLEEHFDDLRKEGRRLVGFRGKHDLEDDYEQIIAANPSVPRPISLAGEDIIAFCYTTGTTGLPKGAIWNHAGALQSIVHSVLNLGLRYQDTYVMPAPTPGAPILFNTFGVINGMTTALVGGDFTARKFWDIVEQHKVTAAGGVVPTVVRRVLEELSNGHFDTSRLRTLFYGAAPMSPALIKQAYTMLNCELIQPYGSTETGGLVTFFRDADHQRGLSGEFGLLESCGRPSQHADVRILREDGSPADTGEIGEVCARTISNTLGYRNRPPEQDDLYYGEWLRTGDLGRMDKQGYFYLVDRRKFMIITGGYNVYPVVVENVLAEHPAVREVAVVGAAHREWGEAVTAVVSLKPHAQSSCDELIRFVQPKLGKWEVPKYVQIVDDLPRGVTGKIDKFALRQHFKKHPEELPWPHQ
jgi:acyl-CoA synthetase (AMP-forming)/AMP-acid ligase II